MVSSENSSRVSLFNLITELILCGERVCADSSKLPFIIETQRGSEVFETNRNLIYN